MSVSTSPQRKDSPGRDPASALAALGESDAVMEPRVFSQMREALAGTGPAGAAAVIAALSSSYKGYAQMANAVSAWLSECAGGPQATAGAVQDALHKLVLARFDPARADAALNTTSAPAWLDGMMKSPRWRKLLYELSEKHPTCFLLNFAIKAPDSGHSAELASLSSACSNFGVFNQILTEILSILLTSESDEKLHEFLPLFQKLCTRTEYAYLYTQVLLRALCDAGGPAAAVSRRLSQELFAEAHERNAQYVRHVQILLLGCAGSHSAVIDSLKAIFLTGTACAGDVITLFNEYTKPEHPPIELIRDHELMRLLIKEVFDPSKYVSEAHAPKYIHLLALATSSDEAAVLETAAALKEAHHLCSRRVTAVDLYDGLPALKRGLRYPVVAMGLLHWIEADLLNAEFHGGSSSSNICSIFFDLLRDIIEQNERQRPEVLRMLSRFLQLESPENFLKLLDLKKEAVVLLIVLMQNGYAKQVLAAAHGLVRAGIDPSLVRAFVSHLMAGIEPPFSYDFVWWVVQLLGECSAVVLDAVDLTAAKAVARFLEICYPMAEELDPKCSEALLSLRAKFSQGAYAEPLTAITSRPKSLASTLN
eukprot:m51a1_g10273 hypothetical protein (594) ;mRNA; r:56116-58921